MKKEVEKIFDKVWEIFSYIILVMSPFVEAFEVYYICKYPEKASLLSYFLLGFYGTFPVFTAISALQISKKAMYKLGYVLGLCESMKEKSEENKAVEKGEKEND